MTKEDIMKSFNLKKNGATFIIKKIIKEGSKLEDIFFKNSEYIGLWDKNLDIPVVVEKSFVKCTCINCNSVFISPYNNWNKKKQKDLCPSCSRSQNLSRLNRSVIKQKVIEYWSSDRSNEFRNILSKKFTESNKTIFREKILNFSENKKILIKNKKIKTWMNRSESERNEINQKKNVYLKLTEEEKIKQRKKYSEWASKNHEYLSEACKQRWRKMSKEKKDEILSNLFVSSHLKKKHDVLDIYYQGGYEKEFLDKCIVLNIDVKRGPNIDYFDTASNKIRTYMIDFVIRDYLIEIKSNYYWNKNLETNLCKKEAAENYASEFNYKDYKVFILDQINLEEELKKLQ